MNLSDFREDYKLAELNESNVNKNPFKQFEIWFNEIVQANVKDANAMSLATTDADLQPNIRTVLLKEMTPEGFIFFTNYLSVKGNELQTNPKASILFFWKELERQVRIKGEVSPISSEKSDEYFYSRPLESQIGAIASQQSHILQSRTELEAKIEEITNSKQKIVRPEHWGGYLLKPTYFEFWQGRSNRLHDRLFFELKNNQWQIGRLHP